MKEAMFYEKLADNRVKCHLCNHLCVIGENKRGICAVRENRDGVLRSLVYGKLVASGVDPIEKKPLFNFLPGTRSFSIATAGCNLRCLWCQNWHISQLKSDRMIPGEDTTPEAVVDMATRYGCKTIAYTYTEPTIFIEFALDVMKLAHRAGIKNVFVTNGYMSGEVLREIAPYLDAGNVDLKAFSDETYRKMCGAKLAPVLDTIRLFRQKGLLTIAGISNVSYGLPDRSALNAALLASLGPLGLDMAIVDVLDSKVLEMHRNTQILLGNIEPVERRLPELDPMGISPDYMGILIKSIVIGDRRQTEATGRELLESGRTAREILEEGLSPAMKKVGDLYNRKKLFLPHLIASAGASEVLTKLLRPYLDKEKVSSCKGRIVLASVRGDIHDIGKNLVALFLRNAGFEVFDLGKDVHADEIVTKALETNADIIALSALMSTTAPEMEKVITLAGSRGVTARIMVGGAVLTEEYADSIGADGYAGNACDAVQTASSLMKIERN